jgi:hypothetical protein
MVEIIVTGSHKHHSGKNAASFTNIEAVEGAENAADRSRSKITNVTIM